MKIKNLVIIFLKVKRLNFKNPYPTFFKDGFVFIKLVDDYGNYGYGEPSPYILEPKKLIKLIKKIYFLHIKNKNYEKIDLTKLKNKINNKTIKKVIVCFDHAIKEIVAKKNGISVGQLISKKKFLEKKIPMYASGGMIYENKDYNYLIDEAISCKEQGYFGWKFRPGLPTKNLSHEERILNPPPFNLKKLIKFAERLRKEVGDRFNIMLDCGSRCQNINDVLYLIKSLESLKFFFLEEPLPRKLTLYKELAKKKFKLKIASGENVSTIEDYKYWKKHNVDIFQPDTNLLSFDELNQIIKKTKKKIVMHNWCNPINFSINANYLISSKNKILLEKNILKNPYEKFFKNNSLMIEKGMLRNSRNIGYGIEFKKIKSKNILLNEIKL